MIDLKEKNGEKEELEKLKKICRLPEPRMRGDIDLSLLTFRELERQINCFDEYEKDVRKRAKQLRFFSYPLTDEQYIAALECPTIEQWVPLWEYRDIHEKNKRLQKKLLETEKFDVRIYVAITMRFSKFGSYFTGDPDDFSVWFFTERYFEIMREYIERVYEERYYFLKSENKKRVLDAATKFHPEADPKTIGPKNESEARGKLRRSAVERLE